ncbi:Acetyl-coenzyme A carboxylase carboxyl transferase subunit beta [Bienertia sinuspersici]
MASGFEPVPISTQKHDPAWKHCQMYKEGEKVQLKCIYCAKIFRGGGIHRIKEHLACQKGNASTCHRVPPDVKQAMKQSLEVAVVKKKRKQKIGDEITTTSSNPPLNDDIDGFGDECGGNTEIHLIANPIAVEPNSGMMVPREEGMSVRVPGKRRRGRPPKNALISMGSNGALVPCNGRDAVNEMQVSLKKVNSQVHLAIGRFLYDIGVSLDAVNSVYFQPMLDAIALEGAGVVGPSHHDLRGWTLKSAVNDVKADMDYCARAWGRTGCSVLVEECIIGKEKEMTVLNFLVYCPQGTMFVKSVDATNMIDSTETMFELIKDVVEEAGPKNVLQVITPNEECYAAIGRRLSDSYPTLYWAPCAANSIVMMLEDFGKFEWINTVVEQCKSITRFIYNHSVVLNMMRRYTFGVDLVVPDVSPYVTNFRTVKRIVDLKHNLQGLLTSQEWVDSCFSKKEGALAILDLISDLSFWSSCNLVVHLTEPILRVLSIVRSDKKPAMGYVYAGLYRAKEAMKREFRKREEYLTYWNVIDQRWEQHQQLPLYAAGFYLNPTFFYSIDEDLPGTIVSGMFDCIERLVPDTKIQDKIIKELTSYKTAAGDFGRKMAVRARESLLPSEWWSTYGGACPNLSRLAIRILSQCCSLTHCKKDLTTLEQMHNTVNSLEHQRLSDQVFTQYNLRLRQMAQKSKEHDNTDPLSVDNHASVADWITRKELCLDDHGSSDWMAIELPSPSKMRLKSSIDEVEELGGGFDDYEIFGGAKDEDDALVDNTEGQ